MVFKEIIHQEGLFIFDSFYLCTVFEFSKDRYISFQLKNLEIDKQQYTLFLTIDEFNRISKVNVTTTQDIPISARCKQIIQNLTLAPDAKGETQLTIRPSTSEIDETLSLNWINWELQKESTVNERKDQVKDEKELTKLRNQLTAKNDAFRSMDIVLSETHKVCFIEFLCRALRARSDCVKKLITRFQSDYCNFFHEKLRLESLEREKTDLALFLGSLEKRKGKKNQRGGGSRIGASWRGKGRSESIQVRFEGEEWKGEEEEEKERSEVGELGEMSDMGELGEKETHERLTRLLKRNEMDEFDLGNLAGEEIYSQKKRDKKARQIEIKARIGAERAKEIENKRYKNIYLNDKRDEAIQKKKFTRLEKGKRYYQSIQEEKKKRNEKRIAILKKKVEIYRFKKEVIRVKYEEKSKIEKKNKLMEMQREVFQREKEKKKNTQYYSYMDELKKKSPLLLWEKFKGKKFIVSSIDHQRLVLRRVCFFSSPYTKEADSQTHKAERRTEKSDRKETEPITQEVKHQEEKKKEIKNTKGEEKKNAFSSVFENYFYFKKKKKEDPPRQGNGGDFTFLFHPKHISDSFWKEKQTENTNFNKNQTSYKEKTNERAFKSSEGKDQKPVREKLPSNYIYLNNKKILPLYYPIF